MATVDEFPFERWAEIDAVVSEALELDEAARRAFLRERCAGDPELRRISDALLADAGSADRFLEDRRAKLGPALAADLTAGPSGDPVRVGAAVGPHRLLRELGRGGSGIVFLAERRDGHYRQRVALKVLRSGPRTDDFQARFRAERQILASLSHPNITRLLDGGSTEDGRPYLVMEYVEGSPLTEYCDARRLTVEQRLRLFVDVVRAVQHAHNKLVVHRDLKPGHILVQEDGSPKLLDFGIAKLLDPSLLAGGAAPHTRADLRLLTPEYASPEQVRGEPVSTATDVYQLGLVLHELLTGRRPPGDGVSSPTELERILCEQGAQRPSAVVTRPAVGGDDVRAPNQIAGLRRLDPVRLRRKLRGDLDTIVLKALRPEPERRYASAEAFAADLERFLTGRPVEARPDRWSYRTRKFARRHPVGVAVATVFAVMAIGYVATLSAYTARLELSRDAARAEAARGEQVSAVLEDLLRDFSPEAARENAVSVQSVLRRTAAAVESDVGHPEARARLLEVLGGIFMDWGLLAEAGPMLTRALELRRGGDAAGDPGVAGALNSLGLWHWRMGRYDEAERLYLESLALRRALSPTALPEVARTLNNYGLLLHDRGEHEAAERKHREALEIRRAALPPDDPQIATSLNNLAAVLRDRGELEQASALFAEVIDRRRALHGDEHPQLATGLHNLAFLKQRLGSPAEAERLHRQALDIREIWYGGGHPLVANSLANLARVRLTLGDAPGAEELYRRALTIRRETLPPEHQQTAASLVGLGSALLYGGDAAEAEPLLREGLEMRRRILGPGHWMVADTEVTLAGALTALGRHDEAGRLLRSGHAALRDAFGDDDPRTAAAARRLVELRLARGG